MLNKYRVHEVAKDFKRNSKEIADILTQYATAPKNHMQVLEDRELSLIFEYLTQHNQVASIEEIYAETPAKETAQDKAKTGETAQKDVKLEKQEKEQQKEPAPGVGRKVARQF